MGIIEFRYVYMHIISYIRNLCLNHDKNILTTKKPIIEQKKKFFQKKKIEENPYKLEYQSSLNNIIDNILSTNELNLEGDYTNFIMHIESFCDFILFADIALFYINDDSSDIYAEKINDNIKIIYFKTNDFKAKFTFEVTEIPDINIDFTADDILENNKSNNIKFVTIEIARDYGKRFVNSCKFVFGEKMTFKTTESEIMFTIVSNILKINIVNCFKSIVQKSINDYFNITTINVDEMMNNRGIYYKE